MRNRRLVLLVLLLHGNAALAQDWSQLAPDVRTLLQPVQGSWDRLPPDEAERIVRNARSWLDADPAERETLRQRHNAWLEVPPTRRAAARQRLLAWQSFDERQKAAVRAAAKRYAALPQDQREQLTQQFRSMDSERQLTFLLPADQRAAIVLAQHLFPFVDRGQREATLSMLIELGVEGRGLLERRVRRMSAQQRDSLREELLMLSADERLRRLTEG